MKNKILIGVVLFISVLCAVAVAQNVQVTRMQAFNDFANTWKEYDPNNYIIDYYKDSYLNIVRWVNTNPADDRWWFDLYLTRHGFDPNAVWNLKYDPNGVSQ